MVMNPTQFDVLVLPNLYGNILTNVAAGLVGGPGVVGGANISTQGIVLFEPVRLFVSFSLFILIFRF